MIISSELTGKTYKNVQDCLADEEEFKRKKVEEEAQKKLQAVKEKEAEQAVVDAFCNYCKVIGATQDEIDFIAMNMIMQLAFKENEEDNE